MAEIEFADGKHDVDDAYVEMIHSATDGSPKQYTFQAAMDRLGRHQERQILRNAASALRKEHFRQWG